MELLESQKRARYDGICGYCGAGGSDCANRNGFQRFAGDGDQYGIRQNRNEGGQPLNQCSCVKVVKSMATANASAFANGKATRRRGQGMPEYAAIVAFVAAVALLVLSTDNAFSVAVNAAFTKAVASLNGL